MKRPATPDPRPQLVCPACREGLVHRLITLHAESDTVIVCEGSWDALPGYLRDGFKERRGLTKRREVLREIREHLEA